MRLLQVSRDEKKNSATVNNNNNKTFENERGMTQKELMRIIFMKKTT